MSNDQKPKHMHGMAGQFMSDAMARAIAEDQTAQAYNQQPDPLAASGGRRIVSAIRKRLAKRQEPTLAECSACHQKQEMPRGNLPMASGMAGEMWRCTACGEQLFITITIGDFTGPSQDDDICTLLALVDGGHVESSAPGQLGKASETETLIDRLTALVTQWRGQAPLLNGQLRGRGALLLACADQVAALLASGAGEPG